MPRAEAPATPGASSEGLTSQDESPPDRVQHVSARLGARTAHP